MELREGVNTRLVWPGIELKAGRDSAGNDVLLLTGHEPDAAWERFADAATELAVELGTRIVVGVGAYPFASPHTRSPRLSTSSADPALANSVGYLRNSVDVPAGMEAVLEHTFARKGVPALGLWVQVPHYVATMSFPAATVALLNGLQNVANISVDAAEVRSEAMIQRQRLDELVAGNDEHQTMVEQLERAYDAQEAAGTGDDGAPADSPGDQMIDPNSLPSGDELAAELERYLRDQGE
jgi:predicted ATP-grasp superfamily ATP-dependent carboligase